VAQTKKQTNKQETNDGSPGHGVSCLQVLAALGGDGDEEVAVCVTVPARLVSTAIPQKEQKRVCVRIM
jgi:hypothetical protein